MSARVVPKRWEARPLPGYQWAVCDGSGAVICICNRESYARSIAAAEAKVADLQSEIEYPKRTRLEAEEDEKGYVAKCAELTRKVEELRMEIAQCKEAAVTLINKAAENKAAADFLREHNLVLRALTRDLADALRNIKKHQEIIGGSMHRGAVWTIAETALTQVPKEVANET
jgi:chromosome segregation ATPase